MTIKKHKKNFTWQNVDVLKYKEEGSHFVNITRQILFDGEKDLPAQLRYFEIAAGGHSTLERHAHLHVVMIIRGSGSALVGDTVSHLDCFDVVHIPAHAWHQFRATDNTEFGFLCIVNVERDRPERPTKMQVDEMKRKKELAEFIKS